MGWEEFGGLDVAPEGYYDWANFDPWVPEMDPFAFEAAFGQDFGQIQIPPGYESLYQPSPSVYGANGFRFDTTTGSVVGPDGKPLQDFTQQNPAAMPGTGDGRFVTANGAPGQSPNLLDRVVSGAAPFAGAINKALETPLGRAAGAGAVGAIGLGAQRLFAGNTPTYRPPTYTPGPVAQQAMAGQGAIAEQIQARIPREIQAEAEAAPYERGVRMAALQNMPQLMTPGSETPINDPVQAALQKQLMDVLQGNATGVSPATSRRQQQEEQETRARLYRQLGPDYELTTPGQEALNKMKERFNSEQYNERLATINSLNSPEFQRASFATTTPATLNATREGTRRAALGDTANLTQFGLRGAPQNATTLGQLQATTEQGNLINTNLMAQGAMAAYNQANQQQRELSAGIGQVAGTVAGQIGARRSPLEDYFAKQAAGAA